MKLIDKLILDHELDYFFAHFICFSRFVHVLNERIMRHEKHNQGSKVRAQH